MTTSNNDLELGRNPRTGAVVDTGLPVTTKHQLGSVCAAAEVAAVWLEQRSPRERGELLRACADALDAIDVQIISAADEESAMGEQKLRGELTRTTSQLRFMADVVEEGSYLDVTIDRPADGVDIRRYQVPLGPVAVFSASNFPLAFSVAGGDTAAALAVGCPVVVKSHPAHPNTSRVVADAMTSTLAATGAPEGVFAMVTGMEIGQQLVLDPRIRAVAFTGSTPGGLALSRLAQTRDVPVPVFAEMGSTNPVVVTLAALDARFEEIVSGFAASFQIGMGQLCTKPGLLFVPAGAVERVVQRARQNFREPAPLLNEGIASSWRDRSANWAEQTGGAIAGAETADGYWARPHLFATTARKVAASELLREECFGPTALIVGYESEGELLEALTALGGSLTGSLWSQGPELDPMASPVAAALQRTAGRIVHNGWPTGVAVTWAMHHGGPFPSTTAPEHTSVGAASTRRFLRPSCLQNTPVGLMPSALADANPWRLPRRVNGRWESAQTSSNSREALP